MTGEQLRQELSALGLTQGEFARLVGISPVTVCLWDREHGGRTPRVPRWVQLLLAAWQELGFRPGADVHG